MMRNGGMCPMVMFMSRMKIIETVEPKCDTVFAKSLTVLSIESEQQGFLKVTIVYK